MDNQQLLFTNEVSEAIDALADGTPAGQIFVLADANTRQFALPVLERTSTAVKNAQIIVTPAGDVHKDATALNAVWRALTDAGAARAALLINVGGGVVTDLGGFAAATYKRGMRCINVPTTLLGAVDAAVGGKTGINFGGLKNQVGAFYPAQAVIISTLFLPTLTQQELLSGYAEMIKHALLKGRDDFAAVMHYDITDQPDDPLLLLELIKKSVLIKADIVGKDPTEQGLRKVLNLGHTVAHAFEALALRRQSPVPHGYAVAWGLVIDAVLSHTLLGFDSALVHTLAGYVRDHYGAFDITCDDYDDIIALMRNDKKNATPSQINFTLLRDAGQPVIDNTVAPDQIKAALDVYRDLMGI